MEERDPLTERIIGCCFKVHNELGPGFVEKTYQKALIIVLREEKLECEIEKEFGIYFRDKKIGSFRLDLIVDQRVIVEVKSSAMGTPDVFKYQLLSYLKISRIPVGLLVNFGSKSCQIKRFISSS